MLTPLVVLIILLGVYPQPVLDVINPTVEAHHDRRRLSDPVAAHASVADVLDVTLAWRRWPQTPITAPAIELRRDRAGADRARRRRARRPGRGFLPRAVAVPGAGRVDALVGIGWPRCVWTYGRRRHATTG